jgi:hypothetical protein
LNFGYLKQLVGAGLDGIASARREAGGRVFTPPLQAVVWPPAAIGAAIGVLGARLGSKQSNRVRMTVAGVMGSVVGSTAAAAWASRQFLPPAARKTIDRVNLARDSHWLQTHPIDYA